jgi:phage terminase large subunit GpA-like protein
VLSITAGVDVQHDRLELTTLGHGRDDTFAQAHEVIWAGTGDDSSWVELDELRRRTWAHPGGGLLRVDAALVDSGDGA